MIQIATDMLRVLDRNGQPVLLDMGLMEHHLAEAFRKVGSQDVWLASRIALTVEEKVRQNDATPLRETEVDALAMAALKASGYLDVAQEFAQIRRGNPVEETALRMEKWNEESVAGLYSRSLPIPKENIEPLVSQTMEMLKSLGITEATEAFLVDLAIHLLHKSKETKRGEESDWREHLSEECRQMMGSGILAALPVQGAFPRATVLVNLLQAMEQFADNWISDFALCGVMERLSTPIREVLCAVHGELCRLSPQESGAATLLVFPGLHLFLERKMSLEEERKSFLETLAGLVDENIVRRTEFPVSVYCR